MAALSVGEVCGLLYTAYKNNTINHTIGNSNDAANWIMKNVYDTESFKGEHRAVLLSLLQQAMAHAAGTI